MTKIHTEEEWQRVLDLHKEGMLPRAIARLVGISEGVAGNAEGG